MLLTYKKTPVFLVEPLQGKLVGFSDAMRTSTAHPLLKSNGIQLKGETCAESAINFQLVTDSPRAVAIDTLVTSLEKLNTPLGAIVKSAITKLSDVLRVDYDILVDALQRTEDEYALMMGKLSPKSKYPAQVDIYLSTYAQKINALFYPAVNIMQTVKMETPQSEIVLSLPSATEVLNNSPDTPYELPDLSQLYSVPDGVKSFFWAKYATATGIPPEHVVGTRENASAGLLSNESRLYDQLRSIYAECVKTEYRVTPDSPTFEMHRPKSYMEFIENLIYVALRHNWMHTIAIPSYAHLDALIEEDSDNDYDESDDDDARVDKAVYVTNYTFDVQEEDKEAKLQQLRVLFNRADVHTLINGYEAVIDYLKFIDSKSPSISNYIMTFIKLLRWGDAKISRLSLDTYNKIYLDLEYFIQSEDRENRERVIHTINGKSLLPTNATYLAINPPPTLMAAVQMTGNLRGIVPGIYVDRMYRAVDNNEALNEPYYIDVFKLYEDYTNNSHEGFVVGIAFENGVFYYEDDKVATLCKGLGNPLFGRDYINEYNFSVDSNKVSFEVPEAYLDDFLSVDIADKRGTLNSIRLIEMYKKGSLRAVPTEFHTWLTRWAYIYKYAVDEGHEILDLCSLLNIIHKKKSQIFEITAGSAKSSIPLSDAFDKDFDNDHEENMIGEFNMAKVTYDAFFPNKPLEKAYVVRNSRGGILCYLTPDLSVYHRDSVVEVVLTDRQIEYIQVVNACMKKDPSKKEVPMLLIAEY